VYFQYIAGYLDDVAGLNSVHDELWFEHVRTSTIFVYSVHVDPQAEFFKITEMAGRKIWLIFGFAELSR